ncbi:MAG: methyl-accepting chemotaxis protein [Spirochaetaceae bacterium]
MKIRSKLSLLSAIIVTSIVISVGVNIISNNYVDKMLSEEKELVLLRDLMLQQTIELAKLIEATQNITPTITQYKKIKLKIDETNIQLEVVRNLNLLPGLNEQTISAFGSIGKLDNLLKNSYTKFHSAIEGFINSFEENDKTFAITKLFLYKNKKNYSTLMFKSTLVTEEVVIVEAALAAASNLLAKQSLIIATVVSSYKRLSMLISLIVVALAILVSIIVSMLISRSISKSIETLSSGLSVMVTGDFTNDIIIKSKDELGTLGSEINRFQEDLNKSLVRIKESSKANEDANIALIETTADSSAVSSEISANINSIDSQVSQLDNSIERSNNEVQEVTSFTNELNNYTSEQMAMVEESTAAITQMIASISSISDLTDNNSNIIKVLESTAREGDNKLTETTELIDEINSTVNEINSMSGIIQNISAQTNLLAMNAAIEAAHAGDAGKGFAVVADEIRKLAEASAMNSKDISNNLKEITKKFELASKSGQSTREAFTNINNNITNVSSALMVVSSSTSELDTGGSQILEAMESLKEISVSVQEKAYEMKAKTKTIEEISSDVFNISGAVSGAISEANIGFSGVTDSMVSLKDVSDRVGVVSKEINHEINKFKTK